MASLKEHLQRFNRKERYWVVQTALGVKGRSQLSDDFRTRLSEEIGEAVPADAFWAMDYHLDWLVAALEAYKAGENGCSDPIENSDNLITGTQEDIDLLVAFDETLVLIEAKADTAWVNKQVSSKLLRLAAIERRFGEQTMQKIRLVLMSPARPQKLVDKNPWPKCMLKSPDSAAPMWIALEMGDNGRNGFLTVTRCSKEGHVSAGGTHWRIGGGAA